MIAPSHPLLDSLFSKLIKLPDRYEPLVEQLTEAQSIAEQIKVLPEADKAQIRADLLPDMIDPQREPDPYKRALIGRVLGILDLDNRHGVGLGANGLPAVDWVEIPAGEFIFQQDTQMHLPTFYMGKYHITYKQFQVFLDAEDGFGDTRWWEGLATTKERHQIQAQAPEQVFKFWNHPFDGACWYDAIAFCRWWSYRLGGVYAIDRVMEWKVRLPTEQEWEKTARGTDGRKFPWGDEYISGYANFDETDRLNVQVDLMKIRSGKIGDYYYGAPTAGGIFPQGASPYGVMDMIGTMWDLILTEWRHGKNEDLADYYPRMIKGGTWFTSEVYASLIHRQMHFPHARNNGDLRKNDYGFRVCTSLDPATL